ncbi:MAG: hypothetical protein AB1776_03935 [Bacillota bacterium]
MRAGIRSRSCEACPSRTAGEGDAGLGRRWWLILIWVAVVLAQNLVHEAVHCGTAILTGEPIAEFRLFTNGFGTSQVVYVTPVADRVGAHWLLIAWLPAVVTVLLGYLVYFGRHRLVRPGRPVLSVTAWYAGLVLLLLDPFYFAVISVFTGGDPSAAQAVGWSPWPVRVVALAVFAANLVLVLRWAREITTARSGSQSRSSPAVGGRPSGSP